MGRVEMYLGSRGWFTTCDPTWDILDAIVVCKQLGFPGAAYAQASANYRAIGIPLARAVKCTGCKYCFVIKRPLISINLHPMF